MELGVRTSTLFTCNDSVIKCTVVFSYRSTFQNFMGDYFTLTKLRWFLFDACLPFVLWLDG